MLLQIAEPGQSKVKDACATRAVGIDLGTTNSLVAIADDGSPRVLADDDGPLLPSVVSYDGEQILVGRPAQARALAAPAATVASAKRLIGRTLREVGAIAAMSPNQLVDDGRVISIAVPGRAPVTPIEVSAEILRALRRRAEATLGGPVDRAVITVPAYFDDAQRQATRDAGRLAGLEVLRLLAEPTAAALAYGLDRGSRGLYAVYDLGGGTFDVSLLRLVDGVFEVKATGGDSALGGDDLDRAIARAALAQAGIEVASVDAAGLGAATAAARAGKEALTASETTTLELPLDGGRVVRVPLDRAGLGALAQPLLDRTGRVVRRVLKDAEVDPAELDGVILVGGSTRSPVVRDYVRGLFGREPLCDLDPDQVVALGAAVQAHALTGGLGEVTLLDVVPLSLGIETMGGLVEKLIHRNTTIPAGATQTFTTYADNQTGFDLHVVQGERETVDACRSLARFTLRGIPPMVAGQARIELTFLVDADGLLKVMAKELVSGQATEVEVKPSYGLTDEEVERMLLESFEFAEADLAERNLRTERVEAERILAATRAAFAHPGDLLSDDVRVAGLAAMAALEAAMAGTDHLAIRARVEALDLATKPFAQARMNVAIGAAMHGRALGDVEQQLGASSVPAPQPPTT
ncbi:MAG: Fe-S protein assembly chaperone HscA [Kofleriaceae bacterium]|nr:Fe-S protein assembly chaperone HscA [Kofleriaceae bacterium]MBP9207311.1 Fe-S protein assembly chaperone HscA [Kofleriaceae bacterium]